ncbi:MAG: kelch repeat-containing protein, partial [Chitinophagales bacterium]
NGDLWIYGGFGYGESLNGVLADLWKYTTATNEWTWINGDKTPGVVPVYGVLQVPAVGNTPGSRWETTANWVDDDGNLWLFGGWDYNSALKNDIWKYDISLNQWAWMGGSTSNAPASYGILGIPSPANTPGGRNPYCVFKDRYENFWLFGGIVSGSKLNDLWKLDPATVEWTWMGGTNQLNSDGNAGTQCFSDSGFYPSARGENRACWTDSCGNFWLFGGSYTGKLNDLWVYRPDSNDWTFSSGSLSMNEIGVYGTQGVSDPANKPGGRYGATGWYDSSGNIWLFGGLAGIEMNDLWRFVPDPDCPLSECLPISNLPSSSFSATDVAICEKFCISFIDSSTNNPVSWQWEFPGGSPSASADQNPTGICYATPGTYDVTLITTNAFGSDSLTLPDYITVNPTPPFPTITQVGYILTSSPASTYQWQLNAVDIPGATGQSFTILQSGTYTVIIGDSNGCVNSASKEVVITGIVEVNDHSAISIYPNPSSDQVFLHIASLHNNQAATISVINVLGKTILQQKVTWNDQVALEVKNLSPGIYLLTVVNEEEKFVTRFVRE